MRDSWKLIRRQAKAGRWATMYVSLSPKGLIALGRLAWEKTGSPPAYFLLFDEANQRIGLKPAAAGEEFSFPVISRGRHAAKHVNAFQMMVAQRLSFQYGLRFTNVEVSPDGVLTLDLRTAAVNKASVARRNRSHTVK